MKKISLPHKINNVRHVGIYPLLLLLCFSLVMSFPISSGVLDRERDAFTRSIDSLESSPVTTSQETSSQQHTIPVHPMPLNSDFGVWIHTTYNGNSDSVKLDIGLEKFILMLRGGGWVPFTLTMEHTDDTVINLRFIRTKIYLDDGTSVDVIETHFTIDSQMDTEPSFNVSLEIRFPFSLLEKKTKDTRQVLNEDTLLPFTSNSLFRIAELTGSPYLRQLCLRLASPLFSNEYGGYRLLLDDQSYFSIRIGYSSPKDDKGPNRVESRFFFGRNSIWDPQVFRMKISPNDLDRQYSLSYFNSYLTVDSSGSEAFHRVFSINFSPAAELQITSIPRQAKIRYDFGSSANVATRISFVAQGGTLSGISQSFILDPLPSHMSFDLTILGERSFTYESDRSYSITYSMDSMQNDNYVTINLHDLPTRMTVEWGLNINLFSKTASGFVDLDMSDDIGYVSLTQTENPTPFFYINDFPRQLRIEGTINVPDLQGSLTASKYSGSPTELVVPVTFDQWILSAQLMIKDGLIHLFWDLPTTNDTRVALGVDTNDNAMLASSLSLFNRNTNADFLSLAFEGIATDNLHLSWYYDDTGKIKDFRWRGQITKILDFSAAVTYEDIKLDITGSWTLGQSGAFEMEFSLPVDVTFVDITSDQFSLQGDISLYEDRYLKIEWDIGRTGYFTIYTPDPIGDSLQLEFGYNYGMEQQEYQYGFKITATDFLVISRTIMWDTQNGIVPRIWILGDVPIPGNWNLWLLWEYQWYEVT